MIVASFTLVFIPLILQASAQNPFNISSCSGNQDCGKYEICSNFSSNGHCICDYSVSSESDGKCELHHGFCLTDEDCSSRYKFTECKSYFCQCLYRRQGEIYPHPDFTMCPARNFGTCTEDSHCITGSRCNTEMGMCECAYGHYPSCLEEESCFIDFECKANNTICMGGKCVCDIHYEMSDDGHCILRKGFCEEDQECSESELGVCFAKKCHCMYGHSLEYPNCQYPFGMCSKDEHCRHGGKCEEGNCKCANGFRDYPSCYNNPPPGVCVKQWHCVGNRVCGNDRRCTCMQGFAGPSCDEIKSVCNFPNNLNCSEVTNSTEHLWYTYRGCLDKARDCACAKPTEEFGPVCEKLTKMTSEDYWYET